MIAHRLFAGLLLLCLAHSCYSQEFSYTHYDISDGLAGSVVYCITQDADGFIWMGTETGVSRFDGTHFRNFSGSDGLPDIEVLNMFGDSKGRVWMAPFRKTICYYYKDSVHNPDNDPILRRIRPRTNIENFAEDAAGDILIQERTALYLLKANDTLIEYDSIEGRPITACADVCKSASGHFLVQQGQEIFTFDGQRFQPFCEIPLLDVSPAFVAMNGLGVVSRADLHRSFFKSFRTQKPMFLPFEQEHFKHMSYSMSGDTIIYYNEITGVTAYHVLTGETRRFLPGKAVSRTFRDAAGNIWFTTMGQGVYRLNSDEFQTIRLKAPGMEESSIHTIAKIGDELLVGDDHNFIFRFSQRDMKLRQKCTLSGGSKNRILGFGLMPDKKHLWIATDRGMETATKELVRTDTNIFVLKGIQRKDSNQLFISASWGAGLFDLRRFRFVDTFWRDRTTCVFYGGDTLYIGTLNGLFTVAANRSTRFCGQTVPFLKKRISSITQSADGIMWISSYDAGLIGYRNGRVVVSFDKARGLTSNICRTLTIQNNNLWVGTDKGLNRIRLDQPGYPITQFNSQDGLGSNMINTVCTDGDIIYVGTTAGLSYFNETRVNTSEGCHLHLLAFQNGGRNRIADSAHLLVPFSDKHVRLEFAAISYRSVGGIEYRHRLEGLDTGWQETRDTYLDYPTLPSGKYAFQLQAVNKFGIKSALLTLPFEVATPWWQTTWFYAFAALLFLSLFWAIIHLRIKQLQKREREREVLNQRLAEMEYMALQAQMNPHFIFNCLSSIQQYIFNQDTLEANKYLTGFARLIRATLNNSSRAFITLAAEIDYLSTYLSLEKLRFKEKMDYRLEVDPPIDTEQWMIPPMLIQPFVENAMRHGLRHKTNGKGYIYVRFQAAGDDLQVMVEDNGIGRQQAAAYKTREHIEYQSRGMNLTADRIRLMNVKYNNGIYIKVTDLMDDSGSGTGTRVVMQFPLFHLTIQNETPYDPNSNRR
ncbi:MAG TPA: histidine kinase [Puia sp.]|nr:histidine kinase [Puia sp.]